MAKRYKEEAPTEEPDFKIPPFDEQKFITKEKRNIKTIFISFLLGILIALISFGFWTLLTGNFLQWELILLFALVNTVWLRYLFTRLNIDLTDFGRSKWLTAIATYFFTWLLILIVLVNPPFYDSEPPQIQAVALPGTQTPGGTILIAASITDNVKVQSVTFTYTDPQGQTHTPTTSYQNGVLQFLYTQNTTTLGTYNCTLTAADPSGHHTIVTGNFTYTNDTLSITSSSPLGIKSGDIISIRVDPRISKENFRVYYRINNGAEINATRIDAEHYQTTPEFHGWTPNSNLSIRLYAEATHYFLNSPIRYANNVTSSLPYPFSTGTDSAIGATADPTPNYALPKPTIQGVTPGFEVLVALGALTLVILVLRKKKHKK